MSRRTHTICVSTSKPSLSPTHGGGGGSVTIICPHTGSILSSLRSSGDHSSKSILGMKSLSMFPSKFSSNKNTTSIMAYGSTCGKKDDTYGLLLTLRPPPSSPLINWKCRLPESQMTAGLSVSPCGLYIVGGGKSGCCYVWNSFGGTLFRTVTVHHGSVTVLSWSDCGQYLLTGGTDGMIHAFSLLDLVDRESAANEQHNVSPIRTWTHHNMAITSLIPLPSGRYVSAACDEFKIAIIEIFSDTVLTTISMPYAISTIVYSDDGRLFLGASQGSIYIVDLDTYSMQLTAQIGVTIIPRQPVENTNEDYVFGQEYEIDVKKELHGHSKGITALAVVKDKNDSLSELLISGDEGGTIRVWDIESRGCIRILHPWNNSQSANISLDIAFSKDPKKQAYPSSLRPVTSILVIPAENDRIEEQQQLSTFGGFGSGCFNTKKNSKFSSCVASLVKPLGRFVDSVHTTDDDSEKLSMVPVPFLQVSKQGTSQCTKSSPSSSYCIDIGDTKSTNKRRKVIDAKLRIPPSGVESENQRRHVVDNHDSSKLLKEQKLEIVRLQKALEDSKKTIERWESVNNKLMVKLKSSK